MKSLACARAHCFSTLLTCHIRATGALIPIAALLDKRDYLPQSPEKSRFFMRGWLRRQGHGLSVARCAGGGMPGASIGEGTRLNDQHRVAVAIKAVLFVHRLAIRLGRQLPPGERLH